MTTVSRPRPKVMSLTPAAVERIKALMAAKGPEAKALKVGVKKGGCAGMEYTLSFVDEIGRLDDVVEQDGVRVIVDPSAVLYLLGTEMDFKADRLSAQFVFHNPNEKSACGCGESVNLEPAPEAKLEQLDG